MYSIEDKSVTSNNVNGYPIYFPDIYLKLGKSFYEKVNDFFSYKIIFLHPNKVNIKEIRDIIELRKCPNYDHKLLYMNCFNPINNYKVTIVNVCHQCNQMFVLSGRYSNKNKYQNAFDFFNELNKTKEIKS